ncbi:hypothetical protein ANCCAN_29001 [Ancylostoma caninum]|uniref:Uncharacterized protein n=1 Tax=Ancylostoma caninum TaxID=29170 RepID=A0A368F0U7_ANCCA|nr:hypothetical protein ANCCAN_29001 [Ancylostoma caninum]
MATLALTSGGAFGNQDDQVLVDALPYLDTEYNDADRQTALRLIDQECKVDIPTHQELSEASSCSGFRRISYTMYVERTCKDVKETSMERIFRF